MIEEIDNQTPSDPPVGSAPHGSASQRAVKYPAVHANVMRYYDLCVIVREAKAEMLLLNEQYKDLAADASNEDAISWLLAEQDRPAIKEWEEANPKWKVSGNGVRARKPNVSDQATARRKLP